MKIAKKVIFTALIAMLLSALCLFCVTPAPVVKAEEITTEETGEETPAEGEEATDGEVIDGETESENKGENGADTEPSETDAFTEILISYLKDTYGAEYQRYYDLIMQEWESAKAYVENVLSNAVEEGKMTEESAGRWQAFISWLHEYTVIWVPVVSGILLVVCCIAGKKVIVRIKELFGKLFKGNNQNASALLVALDSIEILLGNTDKTKEQRDKIESVKKELEKDV